MTWNTDTATGYVNIQNAIRDIATARHVATIAINAAGSGYVVGDELDVAGGTKSHDASIEVLAVDGGGAITSARIATGGAYTVDPSTTANAVTGGTGTGATFDLTMAATGWTILRESNRVESFTINAAGSGYAVNDTLTLVGGLGIGSSVNVSAATFTVTSIDGSGGVTGLSFVSRGVYEEPISPAGNLATTTDGAGTGARINAVFNIIGFGNKWLILEGAAGGAGDPVVVGFRTYDVPADGGGTATNMQVVGFQTFDDNLLVEDQSGVSPGLDQAGGNFGGVSAGEGSYIPLDEFGVDAEAMQYWFSINDRRIIGVVKCIENINIHYMTFYAGFLNQFGTATEKPYPLYIAATTSKHNTRFSEPPPSLLSGLTECYRSGSLEGPAFYHRSSDGSWVEIYNGSQVESSGSRTGKSGNEDAAVVHPYGRSFVRGSLVNGWDPISDDGGLDFIEMVPTGISTQDFQLIPTPNTGGDSRMLVPATIVLTDTNILPFELAGEMDSVFWFDFNDPNNLGTAQGSSEDTFLQGTNRYLIVQNGNRTEPYSFMAILED